jgi:hypothetical protein
MNTELTNLSGTHLPILAKLLTNINGPILELGCGYFSTPILYWSAKANNQLFRSYESNKEWAEFIGYPVQYVSTWNDANLSETKWAIAFIDHGQADLRAEHALMVKDNADFIVLHDTEPENNHWYNFNEIYDQFKYKFNYTQITPHTTILSNTTDLGFLK